MAIFAVDFDGTLAITSYPTILKENYFVLEGVKALRETGHKIILWTSRKDEALTAAVEWCRERGLEFDAINEPLPEQIAQWGDTRKIWADYYVDDRSISHNQFEGIVKNAMITSHIKQGIKHTLEEMQ